MNQSNDNNRKTPFWQKKQLMLAVVVTAMLVVVVRSLSWLNVQRTLQTVTRMQMPVLYIKDHNEEDTQALSIGNLDVSKQGNKDIVFAVTASRKTQYNMQLAYTTNIPLTYTIYKAEKNENEFVIQKDTNNQDIQLSLSDLTWNTHSETYGEYSKEKVQFNAEPKYWQTADAVSINRDDVQFYILRLNWHRAINNKETDMIYITVSTKLSESGAGTGGNP